MSTEATITMEQQIVNEVPKTKGKNSKNSKKQTEASTSSNVDDSSLMTLVEALSKRIEELETRVSELEGKNSEAKETPTKQKPAKSNEEKKPRAPTAYNLFMKEKMTELKDTHPTLTNIERMKMAAEAWTESKKS